MSKEKKDLFVRLSENDKKAFDLAVKNGYLTQKGSNWGKLKKAYYEWCNDNQRPFICIEQGKFTSTISVDDYTRGFDVSMSEMAYEQYVQIAMQYLDPYGPGDFLMNLRHVPNHEVEQTAQKILEILVEESNEGENELPFSYDAIVENALPKTKKWARVSSKTGKKIRDKEVVLEVHKRSNGVCELCGNNAPFKDLAGKPYLEVHHIVWLSWGGEDSIENAVALCPNCHRKMHLLNLAEDRNYLTQIAKTK
ncbi:MAG: HNH endonuclease [Anaerolineales bacterium]|nr:HNH endonuclease [Anaerolineales bacterium]